MMKSPTSAEAHRDLVADHLARGAQAAEQRELVVARPAGERGADDAGARHREDVEDADVEVRDLEVHDVAAARERLVDRRLSSGRSPKPKTLSPLSSKQSLSPNGMTANVTSAGNMREQRRERVEEPVGVLRDEVLLPDHLDRVEPRRGACRGAAAAILPSGTRQGRVGARDEERAEQHARDPRRRRAPPRAGSPA